MRFAIWYTSLLWLPLLLFLAGGRAAPHTGVAQTATPTGGPPPLLIPYSAGWNLISVTQAGAGIPENVQLYTLAPGGMTYAAVSPTDTKPGVGYWAYFPTDNHVLLIPQTLCQSCGAPLSPITLPAGQWVMTGDPITAPVTLTGADAVYVYGASTGQYQQSTRLYPGQGAFAYSAAGSKLTFSYGP
ncbi:MAG TPA: hypothetical protein VKV26_05005 [Dehalococcoidia bacterium]|nr:hypothetical protein [Dehalococcoidia bacterium]